MLVGSEACLLNLNGLIARQQACHYIISCWIVLVLEIYSVHEHLSPRLFANCHTNFGWWQYRCNWGFLSPEVYVCDMNVCKSADYEFLIWFWRENVVSTNTFMVSAVLNQLFSTMNHKMGSLFLQINTFHHSNYLNNANLKHWTVEFVQYKLTCYLLFSKCQT